MLSLRIVKPMKLLNVCKEQVEHLETGDIALNNLPNLNKQWRYVKQNIRCTKLHNTIALNSLNSHWGWCF